MLRSYVYVNKMDNIKLFLRFTRISNLFKIGRSDILTLT